MTLKKNNPVYCIYKSKTNYTAWLMLILEKKAPFNLVACSPSIRLKKSFSISYAQENIINVKMSLGTVFNIMILVNY